MMQVMLGEDGVPEWVVLSQHHGGTRRNWTDTRVEEGTHPAIFVALGSHANYFVPDEVYPYGVTVGNLDVNVSDRTGGSGRISPQVISVPGREEVLTNPEAWGGFEWLPYGGLWGELALQSDFGGPLGPAFKGEQWERPYAWGLAQPIDMEEWYENRLRVMVEGSGVDATEISLAYADGRALPKVESLGNQAILHLDPPLNTEIVAQIHAIPDGSLDILAAWPDPETSQVTLYRFKDVEIGSTGKAVLTFDREGIPTLSIVETREILVARDSSTRHVAWEAPDVVWVVVLYIAHRYRREFDNVLDGIIYGAMVGFGFAMTGNIVSYLGSFLLRGFAGLSESILLLGVLYALNQAMYTSIFGAGLGYARLSESRVKRIAVPALTFALAVLMNSLHSYAIRNAAGLNAITLILTWFGVLVLIAVMAWSLRRQRRSIEVELRDEIPEDLYLSLTVPWAGTRQLWSALRTGGISDWRRVRRLRQACGELAFKKMQSRLRMDEPEMAVEAEALRKMVKSLAAQSAS